MLCEVATGFTTLDLRPSRGTNKNMTKKIPFDSSSKAMRSLWLNDTHSAVGGRDDAHDTSLTTSCDYIHSAAAKGARTLVTHAEIRLMGITSHVYIFGGGTSKINLRAIYKWHIYMIDRIQNIWALRTVNDACYASWFVGVCVCVIIIPVSQSKGAALYNLIIAYMPKWGTQKAN